jgi:voltage-gated potassium channel
MKSNSQEVPQVESGGVIYTNIRYEFVLIVLTVYSLIISIILVFFEPDQATRQALLVVDSLNCLFFLIDFFYQLRRIKPPWAYLRWGWIDLVGSIPFLPILRFLRVIRLLRASYHHIGLKPREIIAEFVQNRARSVLLLTVLLAYITMTTISVAVLDVESAAPQANIINTGDAFWWAIVTTATVGYGDYYPVTGAGKILATFLIVLGVGIFGVLASTLASWFIGESSPQESASQMLQDEILELRLENSALHAQIQALRSQPGQPDEAGTPDDSSIF